METYLPLIALVPPAALALCALLAVFAQGARPRALERASVAAAALGAVVAPAVAVWIAIVGTRTTGLLGAEGLGFSLRLDALAVTLFAMVALLGLVIVRFSRTYLDGDSRQGVFLGRLCATIATVEVLVVAGNLLLFVAAWIGTSFFLHGLLVFYRDRRRARIAARKKFIVARVGDAAIIGAAVLLYRTLGTGELGAILERAPALTGVASATLAIAAALIAGAAILKSAQFPTHGWLVEVMETPTPVSALLHAGILNAGPFLVVRFAGVMGHGAVAPTLLVVFGGFTALFASVVLLTQPTVKVALGYSSAAHMGFMLLVCGLGVYPAAILHLVAHSFYKAHAFLSSGSAVESAVAARIATTAPQQSALRLLGSLVVALGVYLGLAALYGVQVATDPALLAVGAILVMGLTQLLAPAFAKQGADVLLRVIGLALAVGVAFFTLEPATAWLLEPSLPAPGAASPTTLVLVAVVLASFAIAIGAQIAGPTVRPVRALHIHLKNGLYANALFDRLVGAHRR